MEKRTLRVSYDEESDKWQVKDDKQVFRTVETKKEAKRIAQVAYEEDPQYKELVFEPKNGGGGSSGGFIGTFKQGVSQLGSDASRAADKVSDSDSGESGGGFGDLFASGMEGTDTESNGPSLPGMGMDPDNDAEEGPMLPGFGGGGGQMDGGPQFPGFGDMDGKEGGEGPMLPGFGGGGGGGGGPMLPGFGMQEEEEEEESDVETTPYGYRDI